MPLTAAAPCPGDMASRPPTPGRGGPGGVESPGGWCGPSCISSSRPVASAPRGLCGQHPWTFSGSPRPGLPLYSEATGFHRPKGRLQQAAPAPDPGRRVSAGPALCSSRLPSCPCTWAWRGPSRLRQRPRAEGPRAAGSIFPRCPGTGPGPAGGSRAPVGGSRSRPGTLSRETPPRPPSPGTRVSRAPARRPPLAGTLIHPEGGQCPLLRPPRAPAGRREGQGRSLDWPREPRTRRRNSGRGRVWLLAAPRPPRVRPALLEGPTAHLGLQAQAPRMLNLTRPAPPRTSCLWGRLCPVGGIHGCPAQTPPLQGARPLRPRTRLGPGLSLWPSGLSPRPLQLRLDGAGGGSLSGGCWTLRVEGVLAQNQGRGGPGSRSS